MKKDNNEGLQEDNEEDLQLRMILTVLSSRYTPDVTDRENLVADGWPDIVFGGLILEWLEIAKDSRRLVMRLQKAFLRSSDNDARERNLDQKIAVERLTKSSFKQGTSISKISGSFQTGKQL